MAEDFYYDGAPDVMRSKIDGSIFKIIRLGRLWDRCTACLRKADAPELIINLDTIWIELFCDATPDEVAKVEELDKKIKETKNKKQVQALWFYLKEKWKFLFIVEKHQGLGKKYYDPSEDDLD